MALLVSFFLVLHCHPPATGSPFFFPFERWCFRTIEEFVTKARGYSHVDRLGSRPAALLRPERIQDTICRGLDMFKMLPEAYTYRDFVMKLKLVP